MADVSGKFFSAKKVRTGVSPSSPGVEQGETLPPVNPPGSDLNSVGLSMPSAFNVANTPLTSNGTIAVTGAGTVAQYVRGDGSLADFPSATGGGSSVSYYLNGSVNQGTIGGVAYRELSKTPILGAGTDFTINADGYIASFITDAGDPNLLEIPGGNWNFETYFQASSGGGSPTFYVELYKVSGTTATLIATSSGSPELIAFGTNINPYYSTLAVPTTSLALTDRLAIRYYVTHSGRTITMHTENNTLCQIITTFTTGLTALNGLTSQVQFFAVGTSGTNFNIASATDTHTFNLPTASATNRGALASADWTTFNNKQNQLNGTGFVKASGTTITYDNSTYQVTSEKGQPNGYASLDGNGKVPLAQINDALIGNVNYQGLWNAATNTPTLANPPSSGTKGYYYIVSTAGTFAGISFEVGDWIISNGSAWQKVDNTDAVSSVFGRTGNVTAANGDYNTSQVTENTNLYYTEARVNANTNVAANTAARHNAVTLGTANGLSLSTQQLSLQLATSGQNGALSSTDWTTFNNKENAITAGTTAQYFRGDKTFQTLNTGVVPESGNLYFTNARAIASVLTGYTSGAGTISAADSILSAIQKLNGNIGALVTGVSSVNGQTGAVTLTTTNIAEGTNLYYTEARVSANTNVAANTAARHAAVTLGTANGLSLSTQQLSLGLASAGVTGALSGTDWSTFNSKQQALNGTGFVKISGTTISYDNSTYLTTAAAASTYLPLAGGTMTGDVNWAQTDRGITWGFNTDGASIKFYNTGDGDTNSRLEFATIDNNDEFFRWVHIPSGGSLYESMRLVPNSNGNAQLIVSGSIIKSGGTSSQFLKADGSVDSNTYYLASNPSAFIALTALSGTAPIQYNNTTGAISITQASGSTNGFLSSTDWTTFNNKTSNVGTVTSVAALTLGTTGTDLSSSVANGTTTPVITLNVPTASASNRGALSAADWTTFNGKENAITAGTTAQYYRGDKTFQTLNTAAVPELTNLYYTEARVSANTDVAANTAARHNAVTLGTANGLSLSTQQLSLGLSSSSANGALSSTDWTTFNNKQNALTNPVTGTGTTNFLPKFTGASTIGNSVIQEASSNIGIGVTPTYKLDVSGSSGSYWNGSTYTGGTPLAISITNTQVGGYDPVLIFQQTDSGGTSKNAGGIGIVGRSSWTSGNNSTQISDMYFLVRNDNGGISERMRLTSSGNLGLGVTPSAWSIGKALDIDSGSVGILGYLNESYYTNNSYFDGGWKYKVSSAANQYILLNNGGHIWRTAPSGTAGNAISFTQAMTLDASGNLLVGTTSAGFDTGTGIRLDRSGQATIRLVGQSSGGEWTMGSSGMQFDARVGYIRFITGANDGAATERMRITSTGAATFSNSLTVGGNINIYSSVIPSIVALTPTFWGYSSSYPVVMLGSSGSASTVAIGYNPSGNANGSFSGNGDEILFRNGARFTTPNSANNSFYLNHLVLKDGEVLIGTNTSNSNKLRVNGSIWADGSIRSSNGTITTLLGFDAVTGPAGILNTTSGHQLWIQTGGITRIAVEAGGNVTIGSVAASERLVVYESAIDSKCYVHIQNNRTRNAGVLTRTSNGSFIAGTSINTDTFMYQIYDNVAAQNRLVVTSDGNILINTTDNSGGERLRVAGTTFTDAIVTMRPSSTTVKSDVWKLGRAALATSAEPEDIWVRVQIGTKNYDLLAIDRGTA